jgi:hypothetical protein
MRHHGGVATTCIHGFAPGTCLICQTLAPGTKVKEPKQSRREAKAEAKRAATPVPAVRSAPPVARPAPAPTRPPGSTGLRLLGVIFLVVLAFLAFWWVLHFVLGVLHVLEIFAAAALAGWVGYRVGFHHGQRSATRR